jgi:hypothetical protein
VRPSETGPISERFHAGKTPCERGSRRPIMEASRVAHGNRYTSHTHAAFRVCVWINVIGRIEWLRGRHLKRSAESPTLGLFLAVFHHRSTPEEPPPTTPHWRGASGRIFRRCRIRSTPRSRITRFGTSLPISAHGPSNQNGCGAERIILPTGIPIRTLQISITRCALSS